MKILIIEDDFKQVVFLQDIVECRCRHRASIARSGEEGLQKAKNERPDLIILDIMMPGMDGFEVCEEIRKDPSISGTPILMLTAETRSEYLKKAFGVGVNDYLRKPYDLLELETRIETLLKRNSETSKPPFPQDNDICNLYLTCKPGQQIHVMGQGIFVCSNHSENLLNIDPDVYARHALNAYRAEKWRFNTKETGKDIYRRLFSDHPIIIDAYAHASAKVDGEKLDSERLRLSFESSTDFYRVPVEFLFDDINLGDYVVHHHPISRFITGVHRQNAPISPMFLNKLWRNMETLKILLIASNTEPTLQYVDEEVLSLKEILHECLEAKEILHHIEYIPSEKATTELVMSTLKKCPYHILHYSGHGGYKEVAPEKSYLQFWSDENCQGDVETINISALNLLLRNSDLRFVYLNCCSGAETAGDVQLLDNDFPGLAYGIAQAGIPAVLGFRWKVSDESAKELALSFYKSLFRHGDLNLALFEARKKIAIENRDDQTWMSPVLIVQDR